MSKLNKPKMLGSMILASCSLMPFSVTLAKEKPNLLVIMTDEQSFLTLGCYRSFLPNNVAYRWGDNVAPSTPNLDALAAKGAIYTNYYASSPVSSPSRASLFSGCYPDEVGVPLNGCGLREDAVTFGEALKRRGYQTGYVGKWHLVENEPNPGWGVSPSFGFDYNRYMFNTAHQKYYVVDQEGNVDNVTNSSVAVKGKKIYPVSSFLTDRAIDFLKEKKGNPFCLVLSLPDPHSPDIAVPPYNKLYANMNYHEPSTMTQTLKERPKWSTFELDNESGNKFNKNDLINYFGMVKDIDDNVGRILQYLSDNGLDKNTIVVFTSDHGELNFEHHRINKGLPYETSAKVPMIIRYPRKIKKNKVINTPSVNVDFMPTILDLMDVSLPYQLHGTSTASSLLSREKRVNDERVIYVTSTFNWVMATDGRYKLVLSTNDVPWLYDLKTDPFETINVFSYPENKIVAEKLMSELKKQMNQFDEPRLKDEVNPIRYE